MNFFTTQASGRLAFSFLLLIASTFFFTGCTGQAKDETRAPAKGTVKLDGEPLNGGFITFRLVDKPLRRITTDINSSGEFSVGNAPIGQVQITVVTDRSLDPEVVLIPRKYANYETAKLDREITSNTEPFVIELSSKE